MSITDRDRQHLRRAIELARAARAGGNGAYGAVLTNAAGEVLREGGNTTAEDGDATAHAEINLVRGRGPAPDGTFAGCTVYASAEPCAMCAGALFWSGVSRVVFGLRAERVYELQGQMPNQLHVPCHTVLSAGGRPVTVDGPELEDEALTPFLAELK